MEKNSLHCNIINKIPRETDWPNPSQHRNRNPILTKDWEAWMGNVGDNGINGLDTGIAKEEVVSKGKGKNKGKPVDIGLKLIIPQEQAKNNIASEVKAKDFVSLLVCRVR